MPVDVASGAVHLEYLDVSIPGCVDLTWNRRYSSALIGRSVTALGPGWTSRYFATLTQNRGEFAFFTPSGTLEIFSDPKGLVERGGTVRIFGAFLELFMEDQRYIVQHWNVENNDVVRYCFNRGQPGIQWHLASIDDVMGRGLDLVRDGTGRLTAVLQRMEKRRLLLAYGQSGLVQTVSLTDSKGAQHVLCRFDYDGQGRLTAAFDASGNADRYEYDTQSRLVREAFKDGAIFSYRYDDRGRCNRTSGLDRYQEKTLRFYDSIRFTEVTDSCGRTFRYHYLPSGQVLSQIDPSGGEKKTSYDEHGRIISAANANGAMTSYAYDEQGNRAVITNALGRSYSFKYNHCHLPLTVTDPLQQVWERKYDYANRLVSVQDPIGGRWKIQYDNEGNAIELVNPLGARKRQRFADGIVQEITDWAGNPTRFQWDIFGRLVDRFGPMGEVTSFRYDRLGHPVEVRLPDRSTVLATYDSIGNLVTYTDRNGHTTRFRYGPCRRLVERIDPVNGILKYVWGSEPGRLEQIINEKNEVCSFFRDGHGHVIRERSFDGRERCFNYDAAGFCTAFTNGNGQTIFFKRDPLNRVVEQSAPGDGVAKYEYDPLGYLASATNDDIVVRFERDPLGRIVREVQGDHWVTSEYNAAGYLVRTTSSLGHDVAYHVDANGLTMDLFMHNREVLHFERNARGQEISRFMPGRMCMRQRFDSAGRLTEQRVGVGRKTDSGFIVDNEGTGVVQRTYQYDVSNALTSITDGLWGRTEYAYDPAERIVQALNQNGISERFTYDLGGNVCHIETLGTFASTQTLSYAPGNQLLRNSTGSSFEYDEEGRRIKKVELLDTGNAQAWSYEWDAFDRLRSVTRPDGQVWRYDYDALGRRFQKIGPNACHRFIWDRDVVVHEYSRETSPSTWMFDRSALTPLATVNNGIFYTVVGDHLGTPRELIDSNGNLAWAATYRAWGSPSNKIAFAKTVDCPVRFPGQWFDEETNLHYNRFRYYDAEFGAFISQDPLGLLGGINLYLYVKNPVKYVDPSGLCQSPDIDPKDVAGKTPAEIDALAQAKGLIPKGPDPQAGQGAYIDPVTGEQRVLIHPTDPVSGPHAHVNNPAGERLDINGNVVPPETPAAHLPIKIP